MNIKYLSLPGKLILVIGLSLLLAVVLHASSVSAQEADDDGTAKEAANQTQVETGFVPAEYEYKVEDSNNYTLLIRKSLQLYDQADGSLQLNEAQTVYAETNIAIDLKASDLIYAGSELTINSELVAEYAQKSQELGPASQSAWQVYADNADFELEDIEAENVDVDQQGQVVDTSQADNSTADDTDSNAATDDDGGDEPGDDDSSALWWILGGLGVAVLWYLLWQRGNYEE